MSARRNSAAPEPVAAKPAKSVGKAAKPKPSPARAAAKPDAQRAPVTRPLPNRKQGAVANAAESAQERPLPKVAELQVPKTSRYATLPPPAADRGNDDGDVFSAAEAEGAALTGAELSEAPSAPVMPDMPAVSRLALGSGSDRNAQAAAEKGAQSLLSSDYYVRQYGAHGLRSLSADVDDYGLDPHVEERARPYLEALCTRYFRLDLEGAQRVPERGRALLVANRSGAVPWDGLMLRTAMRMQRPDLQPVRWLCEDSVIHSPFLGTFMNRLGAVRACPENAERLLRQDRLLAVFPEGAQGSQKLFKDRYRLQRFGRGGYVKLALKLGAPILPTAIIGAEETNPLLGKLGLLGRKLGGDFLPITPTFPWFGPAGLLPAPVKWRVIIGEPVDLSAYGPEAADDPLVVHRLNEQIRAILQTLVDQGQASRRSVLFG